MPRSASALIALGVSKRVDPRAGVLCPLLGSTISSIASKPTAADMEALVAGRDFAVRIGVARPLDGAVRDGVARLLDGAATLLG